jgi:hypothetical protein
VNVDSDNNQVREAGILQTARDRYEKAKKESKHPMNDMWDWMMAGDTVKDRMERADAMQKLARGHLKNADTKMSRRFWDAASESYQTKEQAFRKVFHDRQDERDEDDFEPGPMEGTVIFDGRVTPLWIAKELQWARTEGRDGLKWNGGVISGVRTPAQSIAICQSYCGQPACSSPPCAGANSGHNATAPVTDGEGAVDVTDHVTLQRLCLPRGVIKNAIGPSDPNHFSRNGR